MPFPPGTGKDGIRPDAADWPGGGASAYCDWIVKELLPLLRVEYGVATVEPAKMAFGGSSLGGILSLVMAMRYPGKFGAIMCLSASFWTGEGRFLKDIEAHDGLWPRRMYVSFGAKEFTFTRKNGRDDVDELLVKYMESFVKALRSKGLGQECLQYELCVGEEAGHTEGAWRRIYPRGLLHIFG
eukprot:TRINITY_DN114572_c0_g1_i1.p1 TRINITY_DN114572_c0_g1~~TRINITY_DN114572_c0_g1_i1.p1  ORF type:complete len:184 (-),score=24.35 TRINITY_DN114572_c0_g1_i1:130-681(-)